MAYLMEDAGEFERLEKQSFQPHYCLKTELKPLERLINLNNAKRVLDAGCGSGLISRHLSDHYTISEIEACDFSDLRVQQAKSASKYPQYNNINFQRADLLNLPFEDNSFDALICRYVYEYLPDPSAVTKEFFRVLKPGGVIYLIDVDGVFLNLYSANEVFMKILDKVRSSLQVDLFAGRKLPSFIQSAGFKGFGHQLTSHDFQNNELAEERDNSRQRMTFAREAFQKIFNDEGERKKFEETYLEEMMKPGSTLFFNKFIAWGIK